VRDVRNVSLMGCDFADCFARLPFVLAGGWGVDALMGEFKRQHSDLDVIVAPGALGALISTLVVLGYVLTEESVEGGWWAPDTSVFRNGRGRRIEALLLTAEQLAPLVRRAEAMLGHSVDVTPVTGSVGVVEGSCLSPALQLAAHDGFELNHHQQRDLRLLRPARLPRPGLQVECHLRGGAAEPAAHSLARARG
jgi:lincosamide nucleotidyltransferase A/C/D/E